MTSIMAPKPLFKLFCPHELNLNVAGLGENSVTAVVEVEPGVGGKGSIKKAKRHMKERAGVLSVERWSGK